MKPLSWQIGNVNTLQLVEMEENEISSSFIPEATPENIKPIRWLQPNLADGNGNLRALVQSFIIQSNEHHVLHQQIHEVLLAEKFLPFCSFLHANTS